MLEREKEVAIGYHDVTMFVKYYAVGPPWGWVYLYKHSEGQRAT